MTESKLITHYTDLSGFIGIVGKQCFWASDVSYMNDSKEISHVLELIDKLDDDKKSMLLGSNKNEVDNILNALKKGPKQYKAITGIHAISFCESPDSLSQWRGYAGGGQGVSLVFCRTEFEQWVNSIPDREGEGIESKITNVIYVDDENIDKVAKEIVALLNSNEFLNNLKNKDDKMGCFIRFLSFIENKNKIMYLCAQFKHKGFEDECEVRCLTPGKEKDLSFRVSGNAIIPYIELHNKSKKLPLREVYVGPGPRQEYVMRGILAFLEKHQYQAQFEGLEKPGASVTIRPSRVPYRGKE